MEQADLGIMTIKRNAAWSMDLILYQDTARTTLFDLTGYAAQSQLRQDKSQDAAAILDFTVEVVDPPTSGTLRISITKAQAAAITQDVGYADILLGQVGDDPENIAYWKNLIEDGETAWT